MSRPILYQFSILRKNRFGRPVSRNPQTACPVPGSLRWQILKYIESNGARRNIPCFGQSIGRRKLTTVDWQRYRANLALSTIKDENPLQFGVIVKRAPLLPFPSNDGVFSLARDKDLNRFQETGLINARNP